MSWCIVRLFATAALAAAPLCCLAQDYSDFFSYNGSFEFGSSDPPLNFPSSNSSVDTITGWRLSAAGQYPQWLEAPNAQDDNRYIQLKSTGGAGAGFSLVSIDGYQISHTPFTIGELYELSFWAAGGPALNNFIRVSLASGMEVDVDIPDYTQAQFDDLSGLEWNRFVTPFVAVNYSMDLGVISPPSSTGGYQSIVYLDNFSITQVPEPGSAVLAMVGGLVLLTGRRRGG